MTENYESAIATLKQHNMISDGDILLLCQKDIHKAARVFGNDLVTMGVRASLPRYIAIFNPNKITFVSVDKKTCELLKEVICYERANIKKVKMGGKNIVIETQDGQRLDVLTAAKFMKVKQKDAFKSLKKFIKATFK